MFENSLTTLFKKAVFTTAVLLGALSLALGFLKCWDWLAGLWLTFVWLCINGFLLGKISRAVTIENMPNRRQITTLCMIKFPVLYLAGLGLILLPFVPAEAVVAAFSLYLISCIFFWLRLRSSVAREGQGA